MLIFIISFLYIFAGVVANNIIHHFGAIGLLFTSVFLIPLDYTLRCVLHEIYNKKAMLILSPMIILSSLITYMLNDNTVQVALASSLAFMISSFIASMLYIFNFDKTYFIKVNFVDMISVCLDSIVFQFVAFGEINQEILISQSILKISCGLIWYYILFKKFNISKLWEQDRTF